MQKTQNLHGNLAYRWQLVPTGYNTICRESITQVCNKQNRKNRKSQLAKKHFQSVSILTTATTIEQKVSCPNGDCTSSLSNAYVVSSAPVAIYSLVKKINGRTTIKKIVITECITIIPAKDDENESNYG